MNRNDLVTEMARESGLTKTDADKALSAFITVVTDTLVKGGEVRLIGFGSFSVTERAGTTGRNPRTGTPIEIPSSKSGKFKVGKGLKDKLNGR